MTNSVNYDVDVDGICTLTMDIPGKTMNTLGADLTSGLEAGIERAIADDAVTGIILASGKDSFVAGADLKEMNSGTNSTAATEPVSVEQQLEQVLSLSMLLRRLETCGKPVAVVVNGVAAGGGMEIVLACHHRIVADDPRIRLGLPEVTIGLMPGAGGTQRLARMLGIEKALPLLLQGNLVDGATAKQLGMVDEVVPSDEMHAAAKRWILEDGNAVAPWDEKGFTLPGGGVHGSASQTFMVGNALNRATTYGNLPAPTAIAAAVYEGVQLPFDLALRLEGKYFLTLLNGPVSKAMIRTVFVSKQAADKLSMRPDGIEKMKYSTVGILGAGTMGAGLALNAAKAGLAVVIIDTTEEKAANGRAYAEKKLARDLEKGRTTTEKRDAILARITPTTSFEALANVSIVIEAVFESEPVKKDVIEKAEAWLPEDAVFASNTSAMPIGGLAQFSKRPGQFIGMHFFSPAERMPLVEIIRGRETTDETLAKALDFAQHLRKTPIVVNDSRGFFTSRFIGSFVSESMRMVDEGVNPNLVENGAKMLGMPMGALTISDSIGLDLSYNIMASQAAERGEELDVESLSVTAKLPAKFGRNGRKNGKGFYDYHEDGSRDLWVGLSDLLPELSEQPDIDEVKARILYAQLAEGARAFDEGVLPSVTDGDLGSTLGVGFPVYLGGPFSAMDGIGIPEVVAELDRLEGIYGEAFAAPEILRSMARDGQTFYGANAVASPGKHVVTA